MIRYNITEAKLKAAVTTLSANWLTQAETKTKAFITAKKYSETSGSWSEIKDAYMSLQANKCAYCERKLSGPRFGKVEHDVEHYRPKGSIRLWPSPSEVTKRGISYDFPTGGGADKGYYWLAYHLFNYATACKTCNSSLKKDSFPIAGTRGGVKKAPKELRTIEKPFLIYPLGTVDEDPSSLITFVGITPVPKAASGQKRRRALVTIDFFELDTREELLYERAELITALWANLRLKAIGSAADKAQAKARLAAAVKAGAPHSSCAKAFIELAGSDPALAEAQFDAAIDYVASHS
jgi:hypothetical protein